MIGDTKHGRGEHSKLFREKFKCHRLLLHAKTITLIRSVGKVSMSIKGAFDDVFEELFKTFEWKFEV